MVCYAVFKFKDKKIKVQLDDLIGDTTQLTIQRVVQALNNSINSSKKDELVETIRNQYNTKIKDVTTIINQTGQIIGNTTLRALANEVEMPINEDFEKVVGEAKDFDILFVRELKVNGITINGRCIKSNGKEVFVLTQNTKTTLKQELYRLKKYLVTRKLIENDKTIIDKDKKDICERILRRLGKNIKEKNKISDYKDMLLYFLEKPQSFKNIEVNVDDQSISAQDFLDKLINDISDYDSTSYKTQGVQALVTRTTSDNRQWRTISITENGVTRKTRNKCISINNFKMIIKSYFGSIYEQLEIFEPNEKKKIKKKNGIEVEVNKADFEEFFNQTANDYNQKTTAEKSQFTKKIKGLLQSYKFTGQEINQIYDEWRNSNKPLWTILWKIFTKGDPEFDYEFDKIVTGTDGKKYIETRKAWKSVGEKYDLTFDKIKVAEFSGSYLGYNIYALNIDGEGKRFFISRGIFTNATVSNKYNSLDDAKEDIKKRNENRTFGRGLFEFKHDSIKHDTLSVSGTSIGNFQEGEIIQHINIEINKDLSKIIGPEKALISSDGKSWIADKTLNDFYDIVDKYKVAKSIREQIKQQIDTVEKAIIFTCLLNTQAKEDRTRNSATIITNILNIISKANVEYLYVTKRNAHKYDKKYDYVVIPVKVKQAEVTPPRLNDAREPVVSMINTVVTALEKTFGITANVLSEEEIVSNLTSDGVAQKNANMMAQQKAFIYNGKVYINSNRASLTDVLHEYTHLILEVMKTTQPKQYETLMQKTYEEMNGKNAIDKYREKYPNLSMYDLVEEYFCSRFANWVIKNKISRDNEKNLFYGDEMKNITNILFNADINDEEKFKSFFNEQLREILPKFSLQVQKFFEENKSYNFGATNRSRKKTNWIGQQIEQYNSNQKNGIKEEC